MLRVAPRPATTTTALSTGYAGTDIINRIPSPFAPPSLPPSFAVQMMRLLVLCSWLLTTPSGVVVAADRKELRFRQLQQRKDPKCRLNKGCANVGLKTGNCCPTSDGMYLSCCFEDLKSESGFCSDRIDNDNDGLIDCDDPQCFQDQSCILKRLSPQCARNKVCNDAGLKDLCCPTKDGVYLTCCKQSLKTEAGFCADGIDNDGNGKIDCADPACDSDPACLTLNPRCSKNKACAADGLTGDCCPTKTGQYLACCQEGASKSESGKCSDGVDNDGDGKTDCDDDECKSEDVCVFAGLNPRCSRNTGCSSLSGLCCPTQDGVFLDCCRDSL